LRVSFHLLEAKIEREIAVTIKARIELNVSALVMANTIPDNILRITVSANIDGYRLNLCDPSFGFSLDLFSEIEG